MQPSAKPSQGERRRVREYARQHGLRYADALRAIRNGAEAEPSTRYLYVPFPLPHLDFENDDAPCPHCDGTGVNGKWYTVVEQPGAVLLCDQICAECEGCGSVWCNCTPLWFDDGMEWERQEDDDAHADAGFDICMSCCDRGFNLVQTFVPGDLKADPRPLSVPCGCMEAFAVDITGELDHYDRIEA